MHAVNTATCIHLWYSGTLAGFDARHRLSGLSTCWLKGQCAVDEHPYAPLEHVRVFFTFTGRQRTNQQTRRIAVPPGGGNDGSIRYSIL